MKKMAKILAISLIAILLGTLPEMTSLATERTEVTEEDGEVKQAIDGGVENVEDEQPIQSVESDYVIDTVPEENHNDINEKQDINEDIFDESVDVKNVSEVAETLAYVYVDQPVVHIPDTQNIAVAFKNESLVIQTAKLTYISVRTGEVFELEALNCVNNTVLFQKEFTEGLPEDEYDLVSIAYQTADMSEFALTELSAIGVEASFIVTSEAKSIDAGTDVTVYSMDEEGNEIEHSGETSSITKLIESVAEESGIEAVDNPSANIPVKASRRGGIASKTGNLVVAINAGHETGSHNTGAAANGLREEELTLKVAQYCKNELESYAGVTVYMVRTGAQCPVGASTEKDCVKGRVYAAQAAGADVFIDLHFNAVNGVSTTASGSEIYYPAGDSSAKFLSNHILAQLTALGLSNRGAKESTGYWTVTTAKECGFPGLIVEHAFLDNANDAAKLKDESFLQSLGIADAIGIANAYGLTKGPATLKIEGRNDFSGTFTLVAENITSSDAKIPMVCVWSDANGMDDQKWYELKPESKGRYTAEVNIMDHGGDTGTYSAHMYYRLSDNTYSDFLDGAQTTLYPSRAMISTNVAGEQREIKVEIVNPSSDLKKIKAAVWKNGEAIKWIDGTRVTGDDSLEKWNAKINQTTYSYGEYNVHIYAELADGTMAFAGAGGFVIEAPTGSVDVENVDADSGEFNISIANVNAPRGVKEIQAYVWSRDNQSDMFIYSASQKGDRYEIKGNVSNHQYLPGNYNVHVYLTDSQGEKNYLGGAAFEVKTKELSFSAKPDWTAGYITLAVSNLGMYSFASRVEFAVWNDEQEMSAIEWYNGTKKGDNAYEKILNSQELKLYGNYNVHVYATYADGRKVFMGAVNFYVPKPTATVSISEIDSKNGNYKITISSVSCIKGIKEIRVGTWCSTSSESLMWYIGDKKANGDYEVKVDVKNHLYLAGDYISHIYLEDFNQNTYFLAGAEAKLQVEQPVITVNYSNGSTKANVSVDKLFLYAGVRNVKYAVWNNESGAADMRWYQATKKSGWTGEIDLRNHKKYGVYNVHVYAEQNDGKEVFVGAANFNVVSPTGNISAQSDGANTVTVSVEKVQAIYGIENIEIAVWKNSNQSDLQWYNVGSKGNGTYKVNVPVYKGEYNIHAYLTDSFSNKIFIGATNYKSESEDEPADIKINATLNMNDRTAKLIAKDIPNLYKEVKYAVWNNTVGSDDMIWYAGTKTADSSWQADVSLLTHNGYGTFNVHSYGVTATGDNVFLGATLFEIESPNATIELKKVSDREAEIVISDLSAAKGIKEIKIPVWSTGNQSNIYWYYAVLQSDGTYKATINVSNHHGLTGIYNVHVYLVDGHNDTMILGCEIISFVGQVYAIMGEPQATVEQMVKCYNDVKGQYPVTQLMVGGAPTINSLCQIFYEEALSEGVAPEVAFAQSMLETGWLQFGNQVKIEQFNFAGIGAVDGGAAGATFPDVRTGVRAQIQHLKAYASKDKLNNECVDPRFSLVVRGCAPYVEWLGIQENPTNHGWATGAGYGSKILNVINRIKRY